MDTPADIVVPHDCNYLKFLHLNAQSAKNKCDEFSMFLSKFSFQFNVIMVTETWYQQQSDVLHLPGYQSFFLNRPSRRGGGVLQLVSNEFSCTLIPEFSTITPDYEVLSLQYKKYVFVVVYRPPDGKIDNFITFFERILSFVCLNDMNLFVGGISMLIFCKVLRNPKNYNYSSTLFIAGMLLQSLRV